MMNWKEITGLCLAVGLWASPASAADYGGYSTEELAAMRGTLQNASPQERNAFRQEWQKRFRSMTREEQQQYVGRPANAPCAGLGYGYGRGRGRGQGACIFGGRQGGLGQRGLR